VKKSEMKTGVLYAYRTSKYDAPRPVVLLDTTRLWSKRGSGYGSDKTQPLFRHAHQQVNRPSGSDYGGGMDYGYPAVTRRPARFGDEPTVEAHDLLNVSSREEMATLMTQRIPGQPEEVMVHLIDPRYIEGEWDDVMQAREDEAARRKHIENEAQAESQARVAAAQKRHDALVALGLPGTLEKPQETLASRWGSDWAPPKYSTTLTRQVSLSMEQIDAILSLIPEGVTYREPDVEDDGWTLRKPEYDAG